MLDEEALLGVTVVLVQDREFTLAADELPERIKADVLAALERGGGFVSFRAVGGRVVNALIGPAAGISFIERPTVEIASHQREPGPLFADFDAWDAREYP